MVSQRAKGNKATRVEGVYIQMPRVLNMKERVNNNTAS